VDPRGLHPRGTLSRRFIRFNERTFAVPPPFLPAPPLTTYAHSRTRSSSEKRVTIRFVIVTRAYAYAARSRMRERRVASDTCESRHDQRCATCKEGIGREWGKERCRSSMLGVYVYEHACGGAKSPLQRRCDAGRRQVLEPRERSRRYFADWRN
jgi:hypothetical protein